MLRDVGWELDADVSGQPSGPIFKDHARDGQGFPGRRLPTTQLRRIISQTKEGLSMRRLQPEISLTLVLHYSLL